MTDEEIVEIAKNVDAFLIKELDQYKINAIDLSAIVNSRLRMLSAASDMENDFDDLIDHLNSQTVVLPKILH